MYNKLHKIGLFGITVAAVSILGVRPAYAEWCHNSQGWWYGTNVTYTDWYKSCWQWIDGNGDGVAECYYFNADGYMLANTTTPDGYTVNADGAWVQGGSVQIKTSGIPAVNIATSVNYQDSNQSTTVSNNTWSSGSYAGNGYQWSNNKTEDSENNTDFSDYARECFDLINKQRAKNGVDELEWDDTIAEACDIRAEELVERFSHLRPNGELCFTAFDEVGIELSGEAENIAEGYSTPKAAVKAWMNSEGHKKNILDKSMKRAAIGFYYSPQSEYKYYWVQLFGRKWTE